MPAYVGLDGGVPLAQVGFALAVARCEYWRRCTPLAAYVVEECVDSLSRTGIWNFSVYVGGGSSLGETVTYAFPNAALFQAVSDGIVNYDPDEENACLQALQTQGCHGGSLWEVAPSCVRAFTCASNEGVDAQVGGGAALDGGADCLAALGAGGAVLLPCSTSADCAGATSPGGAYCVDGYCAPGPCGDADFGCAFVDAGQPCDSDPPFLGNGVYATPWKTWPTKMCSPGLTCGGLTSDGGLGVCATPQDIHGPCAQEAAITGCAVGLVCQCGRCQMPPSQGSCVSGMCKAGVAYCDLTSNTCLPVKQSGGDCSAAGMQSCAPSLSCDNNTATCEP